VSRNSAAARAFIRNHTNLQAVPGVEGIRLHLASDVLELWRASQLETDDAEAPLPYWAFAWAGGLALARYVAAHPESVRGKRTLDLGSGSGLVAIAAARAGATDVIANDIDPFAIAAIELNARANDARLDTVGRDLLSSAEPPDVDLITVADCWYEQTLATRLTAWLKRAHAAGIDVLIGDPGRRYLPADDVEDLAAYEVRTTTDLEDLAQKVGRVFRFKRQLSSGGSDLS
jgi:predicted nicotinamide N-methyase